MRDQCLKILEKNATVTSLKYNFPDFPDFVIVFFDVILCCDVNNEMKKISLFSFLIQFENINRKNQL